MHRYAFVTLAAAIISYFVSAGCSRESQSRTERSTQTSSQHRKSTGISNAQTSTPRRNTTDVSPPQDSSQRRNATAISTSDVPLTDSGAGIEWEVLNAETMRLIDSAEYDRALKVGRKALSVAEENVGRSHPDVATSLNNLAFVYHKQGKYERAEPLQRRALKIREAALGPNHPDVAFISSILGFLYYAQGNSEKSIEFHRKAGEAC